MCAQLWVNTIGPVKAPDKTPYEIPMSKSTTESDLTFEQAMQALEDIVKHMEQGDLPLEDALKQFERGIQLARHSQNTLKGAEQKVKMLMEQDGQQQLVDVEPRTED